MSDPSLAPRVCGKCGAVASYFEFSAAAAAPVGSLAEKPQPIVKTPSGHRVVDRLLAGGFAHGTSTIVYGGPGGGKSSLSLAVAGGLARAFKGGAILDCPEMSRSILEQIATKARAPLECLFRAETPGDWTRPGARVLLVDSISRSPRPAETLARGIAWARARHGVGIFIVHQTTSGSAAGGVGIEHDPDCVLFLEFDQEKGTRTLCVDKCRWLPGENGRALLENQK